MTKKLNQFSWKSNSHLLWLQRYIQKKNDAPLFNEYQPPIFFTSNLSESDRETFEQFTNNLSQTAEGREIWKRLNEAWNKKNSRDKSNGTYIYNLTLNINEKRQIDNLSKSSTIIKTLKDLISGAYQEEQIIRKNNQIESFSSLEQIRNATLEATLDEVRNELKQTKSDLDSANLQLVTSEGEIKKLKREINHINSTSTDKASKPLELIKKNKGKIMLTQQK
jgi:hypothetical protein